ncbi:hypothetical protein V5O48_004369 [Marasmius crinis-equi]|uniref:Uncharacterized protein n=1 Tax=Marasmius crinis-equi TaxID=585013 RepID=A0ABR3FQZ4_9AGAR
MNRKAQSLRHIARPSLALGTDDLGVLREGDESNEDVLRRQLLEKDRECDRLQTQIQLLQDQLSQRPPLEAVQELEKEYKNLDLLLQGTQRENERCMAEIESGISTRGKTREKMLERELTRLAGENWQSTLDVAPAPATAGRTGMLHQRSNTIASPTRSMTMPAAAGSQKAAPSEDKDRQALAAHIEQVRMLVLGVEQRVQAREEKLRSRMDKAEGEAKRFETLRKEIMTDS